MTYLTQSYFELQELTIASLEAETGLTFLPHTETLTEFLSRCLGQNDAWLTKNEGQLLALLNVANGGSSVSHLTYSYARLLDTLNTTLGGGGGDELEELAFADFINGVYRKAGVAAVVSDIVVEDADADWSSFNPATGITAEGLIGQPVIAQELETTLLASGFTAVGVLKPQALIGSFQLYVYDSPDYTQEYYVVAAYDEDEGSSNNSAVSASASYEAFAPVPDKDATIKFAATITPTHVSVSINGDAVVTQTTGDTVIYNNIAIGIADIAVRELTFYPPQSDPALPGLSAL